MLYAGYTLFAVPFAYAIGALIVRRVDAEWLRATRGFTLGAWLCLGIGILLGARWSYAELGWGEMRNALMYGVGAGINFDSIGASDAASGDTRLRFVSQALIDTSEDLQSQATFVVQQTEIGDDSQTWISAGARPQYNITDNWGVAVELGYDWYRDDGGDNSLTKATFAPFYSFGRKGFFARPQLRAFVTWAQWSDVGAITNQAALGDVTDGASIGIQLEQWW